MLVMSAVERPVARQKIGTCGYEWILIMTMTAMRWPDDPESGTRSARQSTKAPK